MAFDTRQFRRGTFSSHGCCWLGFWLVFFASDVSAQRILETPNKKNKSVKQKNHVGKQRVPAVFLPQSKNAAVVKMAKKTTSATTTAQVKKSMAVETWLTLGPATVHLPAFSAEGKQKYTLSQYLQQRHLEVEKLWPQAGQKRTWFLSQSLVWKTQKAQWPRTAQPQVAYLSTYVQTDRYLELKLPVRSHHRFRVFLNGQVVATHATCVAQSTQVAKTSASPASSPTSRPGHKAQSSSGSGNMAAKPRSLVADNHAATTQNQLLLRLTELLEQQNKIIAQQAKTIAQQANRLGQHKPKAKAAPTPGTAQVMLKLTPGVHLLVIKTVYDPACVGAWHVNATLEATDAQGIPTTVYATLVPKESHSIRFMLNRKMLTDLSLSPDGREVVARMQKTDRQGKTTYWLELRKVKTGELVVSTRPYSGLYHLQWSPDGQFYSFITYEGQQGNLWIVRRSTGEIRSLFSGIAQLRFHAWAPNSAFIVYGVTEKSKPTAEEKVGAKRLRGMEDRWPWHRDRHYLYAVTVTGATTLRLTAGSQSFGALAIRPDSKKLIFSRNYRDYHKRPFSHHTLYELDLNTLATRVVLKNLRWFQHVFYSPEGTQLLLLGGPSLFASLGYEPEMPHDKLTNQYEGEAYLYDLKRQELTALSKQFDPSISNAYWHPLDHHIYFTALNRTRVQLYRYSLKTKGFAQIPTHVDLVSRVRFARNSSTVVYIGSGADFPERLYTLDLGKPEPRVLYAPNEAWLMRLHLARVRSWNTHSLQGNPLQGRIYYPPGFDPRNKYPMIVYYYGGTYPTTRYFDGRYPFHLWAAHGYLVYIIQPSGAVGFGQKHAARHVNEWGSTVADEIIHATSQMLANHPYVDAKRVGCIGASYGGFMTMYLLTRTKMFAAAVSHAGISNLASYWGAGYWGFLYSSIATARQYPWSHRDFYIRQSPLYNAHKVTTPLLLIHGAGDTNVPPHESYQMYTALRLLKRPVELVVFDKEDHWILQYQRRVLWTQTILAWFGRQLKHQPLWWNRLHGTQQH